MEVERVQSIVAYVNGKWSKAGSGEMVYRFALCGNPSAALSREWSGVV